MNKLLLLLILSFISTQGFTASCPDGSEPTKTVSADGTYFVYKCASDNQASSSANDSNGVLNAPKAEFYQRQYDMTSKVDQILSNRKTINPFLAWNYSKTKSGNYYGIAWTGSKINRFFLDNMLEFEQPYWNYYSPYQPWAFWKNSAKQQSFVTNIDWDHAVEYGVTKAMNIIDPRFPKAFAEEAHVFSEKGFHGLLLDWWGKWHPTPWQGTKQENVMISMTDEIRKQSGDDFLLIGNTNWNKNSNLVSSLNGVFSELWKNHQGSYTFEEIAEMEELIKFNEKHLRYPKLIAFDPWRITDKSDPTNRTSEDNLRFARLYSAMATVIPEHGYILYGDNNQDFDEGDHKHHYYDVYSVDLGKPVSKYTPIAQGVAYKKFEDGYIAFNRLEYDVTVNFGDFESVIPSMDAVFLNEDGTPYVGCEEGFIKKDGICTVDDSTVDDSTVDDSTLFSEDFEHGHRVNNWTNIWSIKQDNDGNSIFCNKPFGVWTSFQFGNEDWSNYSISFRMKFPAGKGGNVEIYTRINKVTTKNYYKKPEGYRVAINSYDGSSGLEFYPPYDLLDGAIVSIKNDEWIEMQLIASGDNIKFLIDGQVVAKAKHSKRKNGVGGFGASPNSEVCVDDIVVNKI